MKQYFLTVDDKTPIIFNGMLCECTWVESGLHLGQTHLQWLWSQRRCVHVCICACYHVDEIGSTCCFNSFLLKKHFKFFIYFVFIFFQAYQKVLRITWKSHNTVLNSSAELVAFTNFYFFRFLWFSVRSPGARSFIYFMLQQQGVEIVLWIHLLSEISYTWRCKGRRTVGVSFKAIFNLPFQKERRAF